MADEVATIVEIDLKGCSRRFGVAPCTASLGVRTPCKCVNTFSTCADPDNYNATTETITLTKKGQAGLPISGRFFPCLTDVSETEQTVNIAGSDPKLAALGKRATVSVKAGDFVYADRFLDPYWDERISGDAQYDAVGYEPSGTFWTRLRARDPYFSGYPIRVKHGRVTAGSFAADRTLHYTATDFNASAGSAEWRGIDPLGKLAEAYVPAPSRGILLTAITDTASSLTLTPEGVGAEYPSSGYVTIGNEIIRYSAKSGDVLTGLTRARFNTEAADHAFADAVQLAYRFQGAAIDAVKGLIVDYGGTDESWIPYAEWAAEAADWFSVELDATITKPIKVTTALGELSILGFSLITDLEAQEIMFRPNRPLFPAEKAAAMTITDDDVIGTPKIESRDDQRLTRVEFRSVQIDPTDAMDDKNFLQQHLTIDAEKEDPRAHGEIRYQLEKTRWVNQGAGNVIRILAARYLQRFATAPSRVTVRVKRRKYGGIALADVVNLDLRAIPSAFGKREARPFQVISRENVNAGEIEFILQRFDYEGTYGFWAPNDAPDYDAATDTQKDEMAFWGPNTGDTFADGRDIYQWS